MSTTGHIKALKAKHKDLHDRIEVLEAERVHEKYITSLKKEKLRIKDEIIKFEGLQ
jgi:uncharacterized protein YdcH (DUF465 family)